MSHAFRIGENEILVGLSRASDGYRLHVAEEVVLFNLRAEYDGLVVLTTDMAEEQALVAVQGDEVFIHFAGQSYQLRHVHPLERLREQSADSAELSVVAPMPGAVVEVRVQAGQEVDTGDILLIIESMKMETILRAPRRGLIERVNFEAGQSFERGATLVSLVAVEVHA